MNHLLRPHQSSMKVPIALKVVSIYLILGCLWIFFSDQLLSYLLHSPSETITQLQTLKGWIYVLATSGLLYWLIHRETRANRLTTKKLKQALGDLHQTQAALQQSEERFRSFMDNSPAASWVTDSEGQVVYISQAYLRVFQAPDDFVGKSIFEVYPHTIAQIYLDNIQVVARTQQALETIEPGIKPDGQRGQFLVFKFPLPQPNGVVHVGGVAIDITERLLAEAQVQEKEALLQLFVQYAPADIAMFDREMRYVLASQRWLDNRQLDPMESLIGRSHYELFPEIPDKWRQTHQRCLAGATEKCDEDVFVRANGEWEWKQWEVRPWHTATGEIGGIIIFVEDITQRKRAEVALQESEARFRALVDAMFEGTIIHENSTILEANPGFAQMFGYSLEEVIGKSGADFLLPESYQTLLAHINNQDEEPYEVIGVRKDGSLINLEVVGKQSFYQGQSVRVSALRDITDRKQAEMALQQLNAELEQRVADRTAELQMLSDRLMEAQKIAHIGSWECDGTTGRIFWSDEVFRVFGLNPSPSELNYEDCLVQQFPAEDRERLQQAVMRARECGEPYELDLQIIRADGSTGWILVKGKPIPDEDNQVRLVGIVMDITARKAVEIEQARLHHLKDDFLSTVSHELRSPLASIKMAIHMLEISLNPLLASLELGTDAQSRRLQTYLKILQEQCDQELELINNLLDLQRLESERIPVEIAPIHVIEWVSNVANAFEERIHERQQRLQVMLPQVSPPFSSDIEILTSVLRELLTNACKYTPAGETIGVHVGLLEGHLQLRVSNSGIQIAQEELARMFDKFYRIPGGDPWKQGGTGLGLALVKKQIEYLEGTIWAESNEAGVHFVIRLPLDQINEDCAN